jgi:cytochrome c oxidase subunit II
VRRGLGLGLVALSVAACLPAAPTQEGRDVTTLYQLFIVASIGVGGLVWVVATWTLIRYRRRRMPEGPPQTRGSARLETAWTIAPIVLVAVLFGATLVTLDAMGGSARSAAAGAAAVNLRVTAFRWGWRFDYTDEGIEATGTTPTGPTVVLPVGRPIQVTITADDVIHAFYVPVFLFKRDAIPGRTTTFSFTIDDPGTYGGQCAEFCGVGHSAMPFTIEAVTPDAYATWLTTQPRNASG